MSRLQTIVRSPNHLCAVASPGLAECDECYWQGPVCNETDDLINSIDDIREVLEAIGE